MKKLKYPLIAVIILVVFAGGYLATKSAISEPPSNMGPTDGKLALCPTSPNCVCSQDEAADKLIDPLAFDGDAGAAMERLREVVLAMPRTTIVIDDGDYLHAEFRSAIFRFVDDVEFLADADAGVIHVRSASRIGRSDLGVNRKRVEAIRTAFTNAAAE